MNSMQKVGWLFLFCALLGAVVFMYVGSIFVFGRVPANPFGRIGPVGAALIPLLVIGLTILLLAKRQSRAEPEGDERDKAIMKNAAVAGFITFLLLLAVVLLILGLTLGQTGTVPVYLLTIILWGVATVTMLVYGVAILVQYGRGGRDE